MFDLARSARSARPRRGGLIRFVWTALAVRRQRRQLSRLDDAALRDLGLTRTQALDEAARPAWDVPAHWLR